MIGWMGISTFRFWMISSRKPWNIMVSILLTLFFSRIMISVFVWEEWRSKSWCWWLVMVTALKLAVKTVQTPCGNSRNSRVGWSWFGLSLSLYTMPLPLIGSQRSRADQSNSEMLVMLTSSRLTITMTMRVMPKSETWIRWGDRQSWTERVYLSWYSD